MKPVSQRKWILILLLIVSIFFFNSSMTVNYTMKILNKSAEFINTKITTEKNKLLCKKQFLNKPTSENGNSSYQLNPFNMRRIVTCLDFHSNQRDFLENSSSTSIKSNFWFIGDSRIRQQFFSFLKLIPDFDKIFETSQNSKIFHGNIDVTSRIFEFRFSFKWHPLLNDEVFEMLQQIAFLNETERPTFILLSFSTWHMLPQFETSIQAYKRKLKKLITILGQLSNTSNIIWLNQYPTVDFFGKSNDYNTYVFSEKINNYNNAVRSIFRNQNVRIWDSSNPFVEEYIRGCTIFQRVNYGLLDFLDPATSYIDCYDYIHVGYVALSLATQFLYNDICEN